MPTPLLLDNDLRCGHVRDDHVSRMVSNDTVEETRGLGWAQVS